MKRGKNMNNIRKYRIEKGYKLDQLANLVGISIGYMCHLERGSRENPSYTVMKKISKVLNKSISEIFED